MGGDNVFGNVCWCTFGACVCDAFQSVCLSDIHQENFHGKSTVGILSFLPDDPNEAGLREGGLRLPPLLSLSEAFRNLAKV